MKLATGILILGMGLGTAGAQNPSVIDTTKAKLVSAAAAENGGYQRRARGFAGAERRPAILGRKTGRGQTGERNTCANSVASAVFETASCSHSGDRAQAGCQGGRAEDHGEENYQGCRRPAQGAKTGGSSRRQEESGRPQEG